MKEICPAALAPLFANPRIQMKTLVLESPSTGVFVNGPYLSYYSKLAKIEANKRLDVMYYLKVSFFHHLRNSFKHTLWRG